ncbi:MAG: protein tyrosine phosphatase [Frankiales bacterium]|nr:protein tyrosine phosphatase [Frankiales bacterium]
MTWLSLHGAVNVRDVGGLPTVDGRTTRPGVLIRSDNLQDLTASDVQALMAAGVRTVLDLRTSAEVELTGAGPLRETEVTHLHLDLIPHGLDGRDLVDRTIPDETAGEHAMDHFYIDYVKDAPDRVAAALRAIADPRRGAVVVHCAAGKDRTGVVVALALSLVGVRRDAVVADYALTDERIEAIRNRLLSSPLYAEELQRRTLESMRPHAGNMERFLDRVDRDYGGIHGLAMAIGVDEETVGRLGRRLLGDH